MAKRKSTSAPKKKALSGSMNILFTCVGRRVALIRAFREAMDELGVKGTLIGTDITPAAPALHVVDDAQMVPQVRTLHYIPAIRELVEKHAVKLLIPLTDLDLRVLARHRDAFAEIGCTIMIGPEETIKACRNKISFNRMVSKAGLNAIRSMDLKAFRAKPFYPCFAKPIHGSAAIGTCKLMNDRDFKAHIASFGSQMMIQEYIGGREYTIDVYRRRDGEICSIVPRQRLSVRAGEVEKSITTNDPELIEAAAKLVQQMPGIWGVLNAQCRRSADGPPRFFEVNPRFGGGAPLSIAAGVNLPAMLLREVLGMPIEPAVGAFTDRLLMLRYDDAVFTQVDNPSNLPGYNEPTFK